MFHLQCAQFLQAILSLAMSDKLCTPEKALTMSFHAMAISKNGNNCHINTFEVHINVHDILRITVKTALKYY